MATALRPLAALTALLLATLLVYAPVGGFDFAGFDDDGYLLENLELARGLSSSGIAWAFTTTRMSNWHPLTWLSYLLDYERAGLSAPAWRWRRSPRSRSAPRARTRTWRSAGSGSWACSCR